MLKRIAVFFDVDDTLLDNYAAFKCTLNKYFPDVNFADEHALKRLYHEFRYQSELIYQLHQTGQSMKGQSDDRWSWVIESLNQQQPVKLTDLDDYYHLCQSKQVLSSEMMILLNVLKRNGILCGVLTNGFTKQQQEKLDQLELSRFIDPKWQFISEALGDAKPNVSCFEKVAKQLPKGITTIYYLGDSYRNDIAPAQLANWQPIWLNRFVEKGELQVPQAKNGTEAVTIVLSKLLKSK